MTPKFYNFKIKELKIYIEWPEFKTRELYSAAAKANMKVLLKSSRNRSIGLRVRK
jgi:hypothetical protein